MMLLYNIFSQIPFFCLGNGKIVSCENSLDCSQIIQNSLCNSYIVSIGFYKELLVTWKLWMELDSFPEFLIRILCSSRGKKKRGERECQSSVGAQIYKLNIYFDLQRLLIQIFRWQPANRF